MKQRKMKRSHIAALRKASNLYKQHHFNHHWNNDTLVELLQHIAALDAEVEGLKARMNLPPGTKSFRTDTLPALPRQFDNVCECKIEMASFRFAGSQCAHCGKVVYSRAGT